MSQTKYERLVAHAKEHNITLLEDYSQTHILKYVSIHFTCRKCEQPHSANFITFMKKTGYCKFCQITNTKYEKKLLKGVKQKPVEETRTYINNCEKYRKILAHVKEHNITLLEDYATAKIGRDFYIKYKCTNCEEDMKSKFSVFLTKTGLCELCQRKETNKERFGCEYVIRNEEVKEKIRKTNLEKYGVEIPSQLKETREKIVQTNLQRYGCETPFQNKDIKAKIKNTVRERFGVDHPLQNKEVMEKVRETCMQKYGVSCATKVTEVKEKRKKTCLEKYGVEYASQNKEIRQKMRDKCVEKYGVEHYQQTDEFKDKFKKTMMERYGVESTLKCEHILQKIKETNIRRFGTEHPSQNEDIKRKKVETCQKNYGVDNPNQHPEIKKKTRETNIMKYGVNHPSQHPELAEKLSKTAYRSKDFVFPSGRVERIQGYEHLALNELLFKYNIREEDIVTNRGQVPRVSYQGVDGKQHYYFVDIFIPSQKRCIEVKSTWTAEKKKDCIFLKQDALKEAGYSCEIWVYDDKANKVACHI